MKNTQASAELLSTFCINNGRYKNKNIFPITNLTTGNEMAFLNC